MAFGVHQKVSHDISSAFGKGLQGLKVEAMANQGKSNNQTKGFTGRTLVESIMLGVFTITVAAIPVIVTRVPAPESLIIIKEILQDWCTPSVCFVVLVVGVLIVTFGGGGPDSASTPEQNHKKFTENYLTQGPVSATQSMPDLFFSADAAGTHTLNQSAAFPVRVPQASSVMVPVYYPAFVPPQQPSPFSSHSEKDIAFLLGHEGRFESNLGERFVPRVDDRFAPRVDDRFPPIVDERFGSPRVEERFVPRVEERFVPREEERFSPKGEDRFGPRVEERGFSPRVKERFVPAVDERYVPRVDERYVPAVEERYVPQVEERYVPEVEERYEPQEQDRFEAEEEDPYEPEEEVRYEAHDESRARLDSQAEGRYAHVRDVESDREDEVESEHEVRYIESEVDDEDEAEPEVEMRSDSEYEVEHYSHEPQVQQPPPPSESVKVMSPPPSPVAPPAPEVSQLPPSQRQSFNASSTLAPDVEAPSSLLSRRRPPTFPTPVNVQKAPPPPPPPVNDPIATPPPEAKMSPPEPKMTVRVDRKELPEISPRTPPKHATGKRPLSSSSRSYAEFVRRTTNCPLPTPKSLSPPNRLKPDAAANVTLAPAGALPKLGPSFKTDDPSSVPVGVLPKAGSSPSPKTEAETSLDEKLVKVRARRHSTGSPSLMKQLSMPNKKPSGVVVVDDDKLDDKELTQDPDEDDDVDQRVEAFLRNFREQMRLQRQESLQRHRRGGTDA